MSKKNILTTYINNIKTLLKPSIYIAINQTLTMNPYMSKFPYSIMYDEILTDSKIKTFIKSTTRLYKKKFYDLINYYKAYSYYKQYYHKKVVINKDKIIFDHFINYNQTIKQGYYQDTYFNGLYDVLDKNNIKYIFLLRLFAIDYDKYDDFFKIINKDKNEYIIDFYFINYIDFIKISYLILIYPFMTLKLLQKENSIIDRNFNISLLRDISSLQFDSITRFFLAKKLAKNNINTIYSWYENQTIDRAFNYGIRAVNNNIKLTGCQFYLNYENYFNSIVYDEDYNLQTSVHKVLVNGKYYLQNNRQYVKYNIGISLRYKYIFNFIPSSKKYNTILFLGTIDTKKTLRLIKYMNSIKNSKLIFKAHPQFNNQEILNTISQNVDISTSSVDILFKKSDIVVSDTSGTAIEAVSCGLSAIVIDRQEEITLNPLISVGYKKIWDSIDNIKELNIKIDKLMENRKNNLDELNEISSWYKENFFIEPTEKNIKDVFEL